MRSYKNSPIFLCLCLFLVNLFSILDGDAPRKFKKYWGRLMEDESLKILRIIKLKNNRYKLNMNHLKGLLEKAKIREHVSIIIQTKDGKLVADLGSYRPEIKREVSFSSMPGFISWYNGYSLPRTENMEYSLLFKDINGQIKATKTVSIKMFNREKLDHDSPQ